MIQLRKNIHHFAFLYIVSIYKYLEICDYNIAIIYTINHICNFKRNACAKITDKKGKSI